MTGVNFSAADRLFILRDVLGCGGAATIHPGGRLVCLRLEDGAAFYSKSRKKVPSELQMHGVFDLTDGLIADGISLGRAGFNDFFDLV